MDLPGVLLENLTWIEARDRLSADTVVVIALGAAAKEHGPHLKLANDWIMAEYFKRRVMERADVVVGGKRTTLSGISTVPGGTKIVFVRFL